MNFSWFMDLDESRPLRLALTSNETLDLVAFINEVFEEPPVPPDPEPISIIDLIEDAINGSPDPEPPEPGPSLPDIIADSLRGALEPVVTTVSEFPVFSPFVAANRATAGFGSLSFGDFWS